MVFWHPRSEEMRHKSRWAKYLAALMWDVLVPVLLLALSWFWLIYRGW